VKRLESRTIRGRREGAKDGPSPSGDARFEVYTDGGARPNPGPGGWGAVIVDAASGRVIEELSGSDSHTTNNRMELTAAISALEHLPEGGTVDVHTDSTYVRRGVTQWVQNWMRRGWKRKVGDLLEPVKNEDLWRRLVDAEARHRVKWHWLKGHAGHQHNERADELATQAIASLGEAGAGAGFGAASAHREAEGPPTTEAVAWIKVRGRGKHGAWAALLLTGDEQEVLAGSSHDTSANRLELEAGLAVLHECPPEVTLTIHAGDYLRKGASEWLRGWKARGWKTGSGDAVKNRDLWVQVDRLLAGREIEWRSPDAGHPAAAELDRRVREEMA
jgi:ribonuclease HI